jgi:acetylornithine deacetylase/succinyl-diaminopimelate desuccinylase-like protein
MVNEFVDRLLEMAIAIQQIPAPTFAEGPRAEFVRERFLAEELRDVSLDSVGNVYARLPGKNKRAALLVVSAHLDTVFSTEADLRVTRDSKRLHGPGIGDNSMGVAALFGLAWSLRERGVQLPGDVWLVANVGEEGLGDLRGMKEVVKRFGAKPRAYLVLEGMAFGHIYHRAVAVQRYRISVKTAGGHAWSDYGQPSAVHELAGLAAHIASLELPSVPRTTLNVGKIEGGTGVNVLASHASLELDLRSEDSATLASLVARVDELLESAGRPGVRVEAENIGHRPGGQIPAQHPLVQLAVEAVRAQGVEPHLTGGSTDANVPLSKGFPAIVMGITTGGGAHTLQEYLDVGLVGKGMRAVVEVVEAVFGEQ